MPSHHTIKVEHFSAKENHKNSYLETSDSWGRIELSVYLRGEDYLILKDLPIGTKYRITEAKCEYLSSYRIENSGTSGSILSPEAENDLPRKTLTTVIPDEDGRYSEDGMEVVNEGEEITVTYTNTKLQHDIIIEKEQI